MGNQLAGIAPSQIFPVEHYLTDLPEYYFDLSLGSTRFFKVARAKFREGLAVVKVFVIHDPSLPLKSYKEHLENIKLLLANTPNCIPFQKAMLTEKAGLLFRQYVKDNLYDRISTRPFLNSIEKKWIAFQLLCALDQCHKLGVCHGDIKLENMMVTSWNWLLLTDFASFKPTYLPNDNPADYFYFFDTSRRRTCYIAPERFIKGLNPDIVYLSGTSNLVLEDHDFRMGDLIPSMDIFSAGCCLTELFTEGHAPFDFSQLLGYISGEYSPWNILEKIEESGIKELVRHMMQKEPTLRLTAEQYLQQLRGRTFPDYFYSTLWPYIQEFSQSPVIPADEKIRRVKKDLQNIKNKLCKVDGNNGEGLVIIVSLVISCLRALKYCPAKLQALEILEDLAPSLTSDVVLDRLLPYMLYLVHDSFPKVRAAAVFSLTRCLMTVKVVPRSDANIFPEYILPNLMHLAQDEAVMVRRAYAENIASLADTALRFLDYTQLEAETTELEENVVIQHYVFNYDQELQALQEIIQQNVSTLLSDPDNSVKQTVMEKGITRLCVFFGRQKANDVLLSHMITFLNDKLDKKLRGTFFDCIAGVAVYVGWQSTAILKPLMSQGLSDPEEFVIEKDINAMTNLAELGLLQKTMLFELVEEVAPFLCHPNLWIRQACVGFVCAASRTLNIIDVHCKLTLIFYPYLKHPVIQIDKEVILLNALHEPIPRPVYDAIVRTSQVVALLDKLKERQLVRGGIPRGYYEQQQGLGADTDLALGTLFRRLLSDGLTDQVENEILSLRELIIKLNKAKTSYENRTAVQREKDGKINLAQIDIVRHHAHLTQSSSTLDGNELLMHRRRAQTQDSPSVTMNEDWQHMFGSSGTTTSNLATASISTGSAQPLSPNPEDLEHFNQLTKPDLLPAPVGVDVAATPGGNLTNIVVAGSPKRPTTQGEKPIESIQWRQTECFHELQELLSIKQSQHWDDVQVKEMCRAYSQVNISPLTGWRPKGSLVAHLHEHRAAVTRVVTVKNTSLFATSSLDGTVKVWDCGRMESRSATNRARQTYTKQNGPVVAMAMCQNLQALATASETGTLQVFSVESSNSKTALISSHHVDVNEHGQVVDIAHIDISSQSTVCYATVHGKLVGWDLRSPTLAWILDNEARHGVITSMCVDPSQYLMVVGTSGGFIRCWDLRFGLSMTTMPHPMAARIRCLAMDPVHKSRVISAVQGNNEVTVWEMESGARHTTLWASNVPPLSTSQTSNHSVHCMQVCYRDENPVVLTAGSDMRIRYWDLGNPTGSYVVAPSTSDLLTPSTFSYKFQTIESTMVVQELYSKPKTPVGVEDVPKRGPDYPAPGHHDTISGMTICSTTQSFLVTASRDGVVKLWK